MKHLNTGTMSMAIALLMLMALLPSITAQDADAQDEESSDAITIVASDRFSYEPNSVEVFPGQQVTLVNQGFMQHSLVSEDLGVGTDLIGNGESETFVIPLDATVGESYSFKCIARGHEQSGMTGTFTIVASAPGEQLGGDEKEEATLVAGGNFETLTATIEAQEQQIADLEATVEAQATTIAELEASVGNEAPASSVAATIVPTSNASEHPGGEGFVIRGTLVLIDDDAKISRNTCSGSRGYSDIREGTQVVVNDGDGNLLGIGRLEYADSIRGVGCEFRFEVEVDSASYYRIQITHRGEMIYTLEDMEENNWEVSLSLGT